MALECIGPMLLHWERMNSRRKQSSPPSILFSVPRADNCSDWRTFVHAATQKESGGKRSVEEDSLTSKAIVLKAVDTWANLMEVRNTEQEKEIAKERALRERAERKKEELEKKISIIDSRGR